MFELIDSQVDEHLLIAGAGLVDIRGTFVKGTADLRGTILSPERVEGSRFGQVFYDASTTFNDNSGKPYKGTVSTDQDSKGYFFVFS